MLALLPQGRKSKLAPKQSHQPSLDSEAATEAATAAEPETKEPQSPTPPTAPGIAPSSQLLGGSRPPAAPEMERATSSNTAPPPRPASSPPVPQHGASADTARAADTAGAADTDDTPEASTSASLHTAETSEPSTLGISDDVSVWLDHQDLLYTHAFITRDLCCLMHYCKL